MRLPPRYADGTRVANPLEGRTGKIASFDPLKRAYTLIFHDGYTQDVAEAEVDKYVIPTASSSTSAANDSANGGSDDGMTDSSDGTTDPASSPLPADIVDMIGQPVSMLATSYEGKSLVLTGSITTFDRQSQQFRALYLNGVFGDLSVDDARANIEATKRKRKANAAELDNDLLNAFAKKTKWVPLPEAQDSRAPLIQQKFPARATAYIIVRKIVCAILSQHVVKKLRTEKQVSILNNEDIKPKRALINFVEANGLACLQKVLVHWLRTPATHLGALLVLKVLAVMPGITPELVVLSGIGKTLRAISRLSHTMAHVSPVLGDLAEWIIRRWKKQVIPRSITESAKARIQKEVSLNKAAGDVSNAVVSAGKPSEKAAVTNRLRRLLGNEGETTASTTEEVMEEPEVFLPRYNSLGSEDARRREGRKIILLDTLAARIDRDHADGVMPAKASHDDSWQTGDVEVVGRLRFGRPNLLMYQQDVPVSKLLATLRSKAMNHSVYQKIQEQEASTGEVETITALPLPNKRSTPLKSILKKASDSITPAAEVVWS